MTNDRKYPEDSDTFEATTDRPPPPPGEAVRLNDPEAARTWLRLLREQVDVGFAAADDATRPYGKRVLSRAEARRRILEAEKTLRSVLDAAERGLS